MPTFFHYEQNKPITDASRLLTIKTVRLLSLLTKKIDGNPKWYSTTALVELSGLWRASVNKTLQEYREMGWIEQITLDNVPGYNPVTDELENFRKRKLWRLIDDDIGFEFVFNQNIDNEMLDLRDYALDLSGAVMGQRFKFENDQIYLALKELSSESIFNFLNSFVSSSLYYQDAIDKIRGKQKQCPKHDKLAKLCEVEFTRMGIDLERYKILDRKYSPDKSTGAPGYTYIIGTSGVKFRLRSLVGDIDPGVHFITAEDWSEASLTASQISTVREGVIVGP